MNEPERHPPGTRGTETLLIAEDEELVQYTLRRTLEKAGYRVIVAGTGDEAVARFHETDDISLLLTDMVLPGKSGDEILKEIRRTNPGIKAIFMSGYPADVIRKKGMAGEEMEFISKPFRQNDLLRMIRDVLDR